MNIEVVFLDIVRVYTSICSQILDDREQAPQPIISRSDRVIR
jgi:hypothetical protein